MLGCPTTAVTLDNGACVVHSAPTQRLTFAEIAKDIPPLHTVLIQEEVGPAPFQGKALGESSITPIVAAIANAMYDAVGVRLHDLPITAEKVYQELQSREGRTP